MEAFSPFCSFPLQPRHSSVLSEPWRQVGSTAETGFGSGAALSQTLSLQVEEKRKMSFLQPKANLSGLIPIAIPKWRSRHPSLASLEPAQYTGLQKFVAIAQTRLERLLLQLVAVLDSHRGTDRNALDKLDIRLVRCQRTTIHEL